MAEMTPEQRERLDLLREIEGEAAAYREETRLRAQAVVDTRRAWTVAKATAKLAKDTHELAQWELEAHCGASVDNDGKKPRRGRQMRLPGVDEERPS